MAQRVPDSELWCQQYLRDHGITGADDHHPDLGTKRKADFLISSNGAKAVCEVKQFEDSPIRRRANAVGSGRYFCASARETYAPIRSQIESAASQLKELDGRGIPLVVVVANPLGLPVPLAPEHLGYAMYGHPTVSGPYDNRRGIIERLAPARGRNGKLTNGHQHISALVNLHRGSEAAHAHAAWLDTNRSRFSRIPDDAERMTAQVRAMDEEKWPSGEYYFVNVFHTAAARAGRAELLSAEVFAGSRDRHWTVEPDGTCHPARLDRSD
jgi:hypothetical protein